MDLPLLKDIFPYEYIGGGYFRRTGVPKGETAEILHGMQAIEKLYRELAEPASEAASVLKSILGALPSRKDWLDPVLEKRAIDIVRGAFK